jgi:SAM-dependent methyltransferase
MNGNSPDDGLGVNRALWDARARTHGTTPNDMLYDVDSFLAGRQTLYGIELELAGDVTGQDVLHLQCHFGMDTLNWARLGARVTGVDFSSTAIVRARELAELAGLTADFVEADTQNLPSGLAGRFDLVIATYGVLCWIPGTLARGCVVRRWHCGRVEGWCWSTCIPPTRPWPPTSRSWPTGPTAEESPSVRS